MKTLVVMVAAALCALAAGAPPPPAAGAPPPPAAGAPPQPPARRPRSLAPGGWPAHAHERPHYEEPHVVAEYYTVAASPEQAQYALGATHVLRSSRTRYHVQLPVTYQLTYETAPVTSLESYEPAQSRWDEAW